MAVAEQERDPDDRCMRAWVAASEVMSEQCFDQEMRPVRLRDDTVVLAPKSVADDLQASTNSPIPAMELEERVRESPWLSGWLAGMCGHADDDDDEMRSCVGRWVERFLDEPVDGTITDRTLRAIRQAE